MPSAPPCLRALYVQGNAKMFYYASSCSRDDERSEESCEHDDRPTTDRASACNGRRGAWSKPVSCRFARTADSALPTSRDTLAFARQGCSHDARFFSTCCSLV